MDVYGGLIVFHLDFCPCACSIQIRLRSAVIVIFDELTISGWVKFIYTQTLIDFRYIIIRVRHRDDCTGFHEYRKFPKRRSEVVDHTTARVFLAGEIVEPFAFRQVDTVTDVVPLVIHLRLLIDRSDEEVRTVHKLILRSLTMRVRVWIFEEHGTDHRFSVYRFTGDAIGIRHQTGFHLQIPAVDGSGRFAQSMRIFFI